MRLSGLVAIGAVAFWFADARAEELPVDLELVLAVDISGSMDPDERELQRNGYLAAIVAPEVVDAIRSGPYRRIALTYVEWAGAASQTIVVPWRLIGGRDDALAFAAELEKAFSPRIRGTSISSALTFSAGLFDANGFVGERQVIDVSGDGPNNIGAPVVPARDAVLERGIVINGLPIMLKEGGGIWSIPNLDVYYEDCVIGGFGAFVLPVQSFEKFAEAIRQKLVLEIAWRPSPVVPVAATAVQAPRIDCMIGEKLRGTWMRDP